MNRLLPLLLSSFIFFALAQAELENPAKHLFPTTPGVVLRDEPQYPREEVRLTMEDGVELFTVMLFPMDPSSPEFNETRFNSILVRTPYHADSQAQQLSSLVGETGCVLVVQDMRGRYRSGGNWSFWRKSGEDGYETIEWIAAQTWSTGMVAGYGVSADAIAEAMQGIPVPPPSNLKAQYIIVGTGKSYTSVYTNGLYRESLFNGWLYMVDELPYIGEVYANEMYDEYYYPVDVSRNWSNVQVPAVHAGGWFDCFNQGTIDTFNGFQYEGGDGAKGKQYLVMGPGGHCDLSSEYPNSNEIAIANEIAFQVYATGFGIIPAVEPKFKHINFYVMGAVNQSDTANFWVCTDEWPEADGRSFFLHGSGTLEAEPPVEDGGGDGDFTSLNYAPDPSDLENTTVPTVGGPNLFASCGSMRQNDVESRKDVLVFTSFVLEEDVAVVGHLKVELYASSTAIDTDFMVKVTDVYDNGDSMNVVDSGVRARWRNNSTGPPEELVPGQVYMLEIDLLMTAYVFAKGHRVRLDVSSSNYPRFSVNYNNFRLLIEGPQVGPVAAVNTFHHSQAYPSRLILPVVNLTALEEMGCYQMEKEDEFPWRWAAIFGALIVVVLVVIVAALTYSWLKKKRRSHVEIIA